MKGLQKMAGVYEIHIKTHFAAAHTLTGYPGDCARLHGHNWNVELFVRCKELDGIGIGIDFRIVLDHRFIRTPIKLGSFSITANI